MRSSYRAPRSSVRSRGSSSTTASDPREKVKDCCRKLIAFMCTQADKNKTIVTGVRKKNWRQLMLVTHGPGLIRVISDIMCCDFSIFMLLFKCIIIVLVSVGVGGLIVGYAIVGAFGFMYIETQYDSPQLEKVAELRNRCAADLWKVTEKENAFNKSAWNERANAVLRDFQKGLTAAIQRGYDGRTAEETWSFPAALMFCLSVFTMIGYGNMLPRTAWGKGITVIYAGLGIPLYILYFLNMGKVLAQTFRWLYTKLHECSVDHDSEMSVEEGDDLPPRKIIVPSTACLWVISFYVLTGTVMFAEWENWNYLDSTYFCVTSLCKIGIGDFVPGANIMESRDGSQTKLVINFIYLLLGMGLVAMCYNLMREEVRVKMRELREDMRQCLEDIRLKFVRCC